LSDDDAWGAEGFSRAGPGRYRVTLGREERALLRDLPAQLKEALAEEPGSESFRRLFPPAYALDSEAEEGYRSLVGKELEQSKGAALETLSRTAEATELSAEELGTWVRALNDIRLWLGTLLDISEDEAEDEPDDPPHVLYHVLTGLQSLVIEALAEDL